MDALIQYAMFLLAFQGNEPNTLSIKQSSRQRLTNNLLPVRIRHNKEYIVNSLLFSRWVQKVHIYL
jgi:hypothetical protein